MVRSLAFVALVAASIAAPGNASTISGSFSGTIAAPSGQSSPTIAYTGAGTNDLEWGSPSGPEQVVQSGNASRLTVAPNGFSIDPGAPGDVFIGFVTWENQSNWHTGGTWNSVLSLSITLNIAGGPVVLSAPFDFMLINTTDLTADTTLNETTGNVPDSISGLVLAGNPFSLPVSLGHGLALTGLWFDLAEAGTPGSAWNETTGFMFDGQPAGSHFDATTGLWENREGNVSTLVLYGTVAPVPLPAGLWLLITGLGGVFAVARRRTATI